MGRTNTTNTTQKQTRASKPGTKKRATVAKAGAKKQLGAPRLALEQLSVPNHVLLESIAPSSGPVYLEGRLVLSLSFQGMPPRLDLVENDNMVLENFRLWDDLTNNWHEDGLAVLRFEHGDVVMRLEPRPTAIWSGELDTRARVIMVPDLDEAGFKTNQQYDLCWKRT